MTKTSSSISLTADYPPTLKVWTRTRDLPTEHGADETSDEARGNWAKARVGSGWAEVEIVSRRDHCIINLTVKANDTADVTDVDGDLIVKTSHTSTSTLELSAQKLIALGRQLVAMGEGMDGSL